jgi:hypothetical protein
MVWERNGGSAHALLIAVIGVGLFNAAQVGCMAEQTDSKRIEIRDQGGELGFTIEPLKESFAVGESIRFQVRGDHPYYLYMFSLDRKANTATLILPNDRQRERRYAANAYFEVPGSAINFYSDHAGQEEVLVVATSDTQVFDTTGNKRPDDSPIASLDDIEAQIDKLIRRHGKEWDYVPTVKTLRLPVENVAAGSGGRDPIVFIASNQSQIGLGEAIRIVFGADAPGWVHVYSEFPDEPRTLLRSQEITGEDVHSLIVHPKKKAGSYSLVAVYSDQEERKSDTAAVAGSQARDEDTASKGLRPIQPDTAKVEPGSKAVFRFVVQDNL